MNQLKLHILISLIVLISSIMISCNMLSSSDISVTPASTVINQFETLFIDINLKRPFQNPYDPEDIRVDAIINNTEGEKDMALWLRPAQK